MMLGMMKYHLLMLIREPANVFFGLALPFLMMFIMASGQEDVSIIMNFAFPVYITIAILALAITDSALTHAHSRQIKFLHRLKMTPVSPATYLLSSILTRLIVLAVFVATFLGFNVIFFHVSLAERNWVAIAVALVLTFAMLYFIGMFLANFLKNTRTTQSVLHITFWALLLLMNGFFHGEVLPNALRVFVENTPTLYALELLEAAWLNTGLFEGHAFMVVVGITVVFGTLSIAFFKYE